MRKSPQDSAITEDDLRSYLSAGAGDDFTFELSTLSLVDELGFNCEHSGFYEDPVTGKVRQFDIRAVREARGLKMYLTIECKNVRAQSPILVSSVPRMDHESFHCVAHVIDQVARFQSAGAAYLDRAQVLRITSAASIYQTSRSVGKSIVQVERRNGEFRASDGDVFEKWSQALASGADLLHRAYKAPADAKGFLCGFMPIVVVPNERLWVAKYDDRGHLIAGPERVDRCSFFVGRKYPLTESREAPVYEVSHLEIVTQIGLYDLLTKVVDTNFRSNNFFSKHVLEH